MGYLILAAGLLALLIFTAGRRSLNATWSRIFLWWWTLILFVSTFNPYDLYQVDASIYAIMGLLVFSYVAGLSFSAQRSGKKMELALVNAVAECKSLINSNPLKLFALLITVVLAYYFNQYSSYLLVAGIEESRSARFELGAIFASAYEAALFGYVVGGGIWPLKFVVAYALVYPGVAPWSWILSAIACMLYLGFGAGRNILIEIALMTLFLLVLSYAGQGNWVERKKRIKWICGALSCLYLMAVLATFIRLMPHEGVSPSSFIKAADVLMEHLIVYFCGSLRLFEYAVNNYQGILGLNYGRVTLAGPDEVVTVVFRLLGYDTIPFSNIWGMLLAERIAIGNDTYMNALYTAAFNFYFDFGVAGVCIWAGVFGVLCALSLKRLCRRARAWDLFIVTMFFVTAMLTPLTWKLTTGASVLIIALAYIVGSISIRKGTEKAELP